MGRAKHRSLQLDVRCKNMVAMDAALRQALHGNSRRPPNPCRILIVAPIPDCASLARINAKRQPSLPLFSWRFPVSACGGFGIRFLAVFLAELFDASRGVDDLLLSGIEGVTRGTYFNVQRFAQR